MSNLTVLRKYAQVAPEKLPPSVLFSHSDNALVLYDAFPKAMFHLLALPRISSEMSSSSAMTNLQTLLKGDKEEAKKVLLSLKEIASQACVEIEGEMKRLHGRVWPIWKGFHADRLKHKKHYNSFHPKLGFFIDIDQVLEWFDAHPSYYKKMAALNPKDYEPLVKREMSCWRCSKSLKNVPTLKEHLQEHFDSCVPKEGSATKRKREDKDKDEHSSKKSKEEA